MTPLAFTSRTRNFAAAAASAVAVLGVVAYITAPVAANPLLASAYSASRHPVVSGVVRSHARGQMRKARVTLVFRDAHGHVLARAQPSIDRRGRWRVAIPRGAAQVTVGVSDGGRATKLTEPIKPGQSLELTAVLPSNPAGLLPGLFPY